MEQQVVAVGERIRSHLPAGLSQRRFAGLVDMTPDALSRALNGQRGFSSIELAKIADLLGVDMYWLVTGQEDPLRVTIAARHDWDPLLAVRLNPGREADEEILRRIAAVYREAYPEWAPASLKLPKDPARLRELLGERFVRRFAAQIELALGVDVIRVPEISTDYSLRVGGRSVILLVNTPNWFRNNWSAAHELGHLALGHHAGTAVQEANEPLADQFAAALLLPGRWMRKVQWSQLDVGALAQLVWEAGVSTEALRNRLRTLRISVPVEITAALHQPTQRLLRKHADALAGASAGIDAIVQREAESTGRTFPLRLLTDLARRVETGDADPGALAWALDVPIDEIDFPEPDEDAASRQYEQLIDTRPNAAMWEEKLGTNASAW